MLLTGELTSSERLFIARGADQFLRLRLLVKLKVTLLTCFAAEIWLGTHPALKKGSLCLKVLIFPFVPIGMPVKDWLLADLLRSEGLVC